MRKNQNLKFLRFFELSIILVVLCVSLGSALPLVGHPASEVFPGGFQTGDYYFPSGKVGIGTTSPTGLLHLNSASDTYLKMQSSGTSGATYNLISGSDGNFYITEAGVATRLTILKTTGNIGIGTTSPTYKLQVAGSFAATSKNFDIPDPRYNDSRHRLIHSSLEGPEYAVFYRGEAQLQNGRAVIELPRYFEALTKKEGRTVLLTNIDGGDVIWVQTQDNQQVKDGRFIVVSSNPHSTQRFNWEVKAVRKDLGPLIAEVVR